jgi:hypothetical protein
MNLAPVIWISRSNSQPVEIEERTKFAIHSGGPHYDAGYEATHIW